MNRVANNEHRAPAVSCASCRWLSAGQLVVFGARESEERVICLKGRWKSGSVQSWSLEHHVGRYQGIAQACTEYKGVTPQRGAMTDKNVCPTEKQKLPVVGQEGGGGRRV